MATTPQLLANKVAFIAGAANTFGKAIARKFADHGATVILADVNNKYTACDNIASDINNSNPKKAQAVKCNVSDPKEILKEIQAAKQQHANRLDIFYNNTEVDDYVSPIVSNVVNNTMQVHVQSVLESIMYAGEEIKSSTQNGGCILCTGSTMGLLGDMVPSAYSISKNSLIDVVRAAAAELASKNVRVNAISPATFDPQQRLLLNTLIPSATAHQKKLEEMIRNYMNYPVVDQDVAKAAVFLASEYGASVNGHNLVLSGKFPLY